MLHTVIEIDKATNILKPLGNKTRQTMMRLMIIMLVVYVNF